MWFLGLKDWKRLHTLLCILLSMKSKIDVISSTKSYRVTGKKENMFAVAPILFAQYSNWNIWLIDDLEHINGQNHSPYCTINKCVILIPTSP